MYTYQKSQKQEKNLSLRNKNMLNMQFKQDESESNTAYSNETRLKLREGLFQREKQISYSYIPDSVIEQGDNSGLSMENINAMYHVGKTAQLQSINISKNVSSLMGSDKINQNQERIQKKENRTGLPDNLKEGVENFSGMSMDNVKVHYNSDKPSQVGALAYTQGNEIHVAPGQEKHLPHEAWHVVQQKQGRVKPTIQMKGVSINDDRVLEKEATDMGEKAVIQNRNDKQLSNINVSKFIIQKADPEEKMDISEPSSVSSTLKDVLAKENSLKILNRVQKIRDTVPRMKKKLDSEFRVDFETIITEVDRLIELIGKVQDYESAMCLNEEIKTISEGIMFKELEKLVESQLELEGAKDEESKKRIQEKEKLLIKDRERKLEIESQQAIRSNLLRKANDAITKEDVTMVAAVYDPESNEYYCGRSGRDNSRYPIPAEILGSIPDATDESREMRCFGKNCAEVNALGNMFEKRIEKKILSKKMEGCIFVAVENKTGRIHAPCVNGCQKWISANKGSWI